MWGARCEFSLLLILHLLKLKLLMERSVKGYIFLFLKGMAMGAADVVPGVSGGTIAFISGIYEELLGSISSINFKTVAILKKEGISFNWSFHK